MAIKHVSLKSFKSPKRLVNIGLFCFLVIIVVVGTVMFVYYGTTEATLDKGFYENIGKSNVGTKAADIQSADAVHLALKTTGFDQNSNRFAFNLRIYPLGKYKLEEMTSNTNLTMVSDKITRKWVSIDGYFNPIPVLDYFVVSNGNNAMYPFDIHSVNYTMVYYENSSPSTTIPVTMEFRNILQGYKISANFQATATKGILVNIIIERSTFTKFYSLFTSLIMWLLAINVLQFAIKGIFNSQRKVEGPIMGACIAMLFALPALRNSQPGIPSIGVLSDMLAFIWAETLIVFTAISMIVMYVLRNIVDKRERERLISEKAKAAVAGAVAGALVGAVAAENEDDGLAAANAADIWGDGGADVGGNGDFGSEATLDMGAF